MQLRCELQLTSEMFVQVQPLQLKEIERNVQNKNGLGFDNLGTQ